MGRGSYTEAASPRRLFRLRGRRAPMRRFSVAEPAVLFFSVLAILEKSSPTSSDSNLPECAQETLNATSFHMSLGYCCLSEASPGTLSTVASSNPFSWKNSAPWALGCWLHPFCGPLKSPVGISSPSRGKILPSTFGLSDGACFRIPELEGTSRASGPPWERG